MNRCNGLQLLDVADSMKCCSGIQSISRLPKLHDLFDFTQQSPFLGVSIRTVSCSAGNIAIVGYLEPNVGMESQRSGFRVAR